MTLQQPKSKFYRAVRYSFTHSHQMVGSKDLFFSYRLFEHVMSSGGSGSTGIVTPTQPAANKFATAFFDIRIWRNIFMTVSLELFRKISSGLKLPSSSRFSGSIRKQITELYQHNLKLCSLYWSINLIPRPFLKVDDSFVIRTHPTTCLSPSFCSIYVIIFTRQLFNGKKLIW